MMRILFFVFSCILPAVILAGCVDDEYNDRYANSNRYDCSRGRCDIRPQYPHNRPGMNRPTRPNYNRPVMNQPTRPNYNRPSMNRPTRPNDNRPGMNRPTRPNDNRPGMNRPTRPNDNRPSMGRPTACTADFRPVCASRGSDRKTFPNACAAQASGFKVVGQGGC